MVESTKDEVAAPQQEEKSRNWADEVDGGDDDEAEIGGDAATVPQILPEEEKVSYAPPEKRKRNAQGDFVVTTIKLKELQDREKAPEELDEDEDSDESEQSEQEEEKEEAPKSKWSASC
jgi:hypothetical protein